jgi:hypothetical protein
MLGCRAAVPAPTGQGESSSKAAAALSASSQLMMPLYTSTHTAAASSQVMMSPYINEHTAALSVLSHGLICCSPWRPTSCNEERRCLQGQATGAIRMKRQGLKSQLLRGPWPTRHCPLALLQPQPSCVQMVAKLCCLPALPRTSCLEAHANAAQHDTGHRQGKQKSFKAHWELHPAICKHHCWPGEVGEP